MARLLEAVASFLVIAVVAKIMLAAILCELHEWRSWRYVAGLLRRPAPPAPAVRSLEQICTDACRIRELYHHHGMRFAQYEGRRQAFDRVLTEAAETLRIDHLLGVLAPGPDRDRERARLEEVLVTFGILPAASDGGGTGSR